MAAWLIVTDEDGIVLERIKLVYGKAEPDAFDLAKPLGRVAVVETLVNALMLHEGVPVSEKGREV